MATTTTSKTTKSPTTTSKTTISPTTNSATTISCINLLPTAISNLQIELTDLHNKYNGFLTSTSGKSSDSTFKSKFSTFITSKNTYYDNLYTYFNSITEADVNNDCTTVYNNVISKISEATTLISQIPPPPTRRKRTITSISNSTVVFTIDGTFTTCTSTYKEFKVSIDITSTQSISWTGSKSSLTCITATTQNPTTLIPGTTMATTLIPVLTTQKPTTLTTKKPATTSKTTISPTTLNPKTTQKPTTTTKKPTTISKTTISPTTQKPTTTTKKPTTASKTTIAPTTVTSKTTQKPTTLTTKKPTTTSKTTISPTTLTPKTTQKPTTTTKKPTTASKTSIAPTTVIPKTTQKPTTITTKQPTPIPCINLLPIAVSNLETELKKLFSSYSNLLSSVDVQSKSETFKSNLNSYISSLNTYYDDLQTYINSISEIVVNNDCITVYTNINSKISDATSLTNSIPSTRKKRAITNISNNAIKFSLEGTSATCTVTYQTFSAKFNLTSKQSIEWTGIKSALVCITPTTQIPTIAPTRKPTPLIPTPIQTPAPKPTTAPIPTQRPCTIDLEISLSTLKSTLEITYQSLITSIDNIKAKESFTKDDETYLKSFFTSSNIFYKKVKDYFDTLVQDDITVSCPSVISDLNSLTSEANLLIGSIPLIIKRRKRAVTFVSTEEIIISVKFGDAGYTCAIDVAKNIGNYNDPLEINWNSITFATFCGEIKYDVVSIEEEVTFTYSFLDYEELLKEGKTVREKIMQSGNSADDVSTKSSTNLRRKKRSKIPSAADAEYAGLITSDLILNGSEPRILPASEVPCIRPLSVVIKKVEFTYTSARAVNKGCDENDPNVAPPYFEIVDIFNTTTRFCNFEGNYTIHAFGDFLKSRMVSDGSKDLVPNIEYTVKEADHCCGGVFYHKYNSTLRSNQLQATSHKYPEDYEANTRCPYVFRCLPDHENEICKIHIHFVDFELESSNQEIVDRLTGRFPESNNRAVTSEGPFARMENKTELCDNKDQLWVSTCKTVYTESTERFCSASEPIKSITAEEQILVYFQSNGIQQDRGFVISYHAVQDEKSDTGITCDLTQQERDASFCRCGLSIPKLIRAAAEPDIKVNCTVHDANNTQTSTDKPSTGKPLTEKPSQVRKVEKETNGINTIKRKYKGIRNMKKIDEKKVNTPVKKIIGNGNTFGKKKIISKGIVKKPLNKPIDNENIFGKKKMISNGSVNKPKQINNGNTFVKKAVNSGGNMKKPLVKKINNGNSFGTKTGVSKGTLKKPINKLKNGYNNGSNGVRKTNTRAKRDTSINKFENRKVFPNGKKVIQLKKGNGESKDTKISNNQKSNSNFKNTSNKKLFINKNASNKGSNGPGIKKLVKPNINGQYKKTGNYKNPSMIRKIKSEKDNSDIKNERTEMQKKFAIKRKTSNIPRIGGGKTNKARETMSFAVIVVQFQPTESKQLTAKKVQRQCGGTLIHKNWVITTSSCCTYCHYIWYKKWIKRKNKENKGRKRRDTRKILKPSLRQKDNNKGNGKKKKKNQKKKRHPKYKDIWMFFGKQKFIVNKKNKKIKGAKAEKAYSEVHRIKFPEECGVRLQQQKDGELKDGSYNVVCPILLRLKPNRKLIIDVNVDFPACLPLAETFDRETIIGGSVGWGKKTYNQKLFRSKQAKVIAGMKKYPSSTCQEELRNQGILDDNIFCTKNENEKKHMCTGDEGSALMVYSKGECFAEHVSTFAILAVPGCVDKNSKDNIKEDEKKTLNTGSRSIRSVGYVKKKTFIKKKPSINNDKESRITKEENQKVFQNIKANSSKGKTIKNGNPINKYIEKKPNTFKAGMNNNNIQNGNAPKTSNMIKKKLPQQKKSNPFKAGMNYNNIHNGNVPKTSNMIKKKLPQQKKFTHFNARQKGQNTAKNGMSYAKFDELYSQDLTTNQNIDLWIEVGSYVKWISEVLFKEGEKDVCLRPISNSTEPEPEPCHNNETEVEHHKILTCPIKTPRVAYDSTIKQ